MSAWQRVLLRWVLRHTLLAGSATITDGGPHRRRRAADYGRATPSLCQRRPTSPRSEGCQPPRHSHLDCRCVLTLIVARQGTGRGHDRLTCTRQIDVAHDAIPPPADWRRRFEPPPQAAVARWPRKRPAAARSTLGYRRVRQFQKRKRDGTQQRRKGPRFRRDSAASPTFGVQAKRGLHRGCATDGEPGECSSGIHQPRSVDSVGRQMSPAA